MLIISATSLILSSSAIVIAVPLISNDVSVAALEKSKSRKTVVVAVAVTHALVNVDSGALLADQDLHQF